MKRAQTPNERGECESCRWLMAADKVWHNGGFCHARCAAEHERLILGEDAAPGLLEHLDALDAHAAFLERLGGEAAKLGIDFNKLMIAVERADAA